MHLKHTPERLILLSFEKIRQVKADLSAKPNEPPSGAYLEEFEQELAATKEHLQTVVEELETSNEELQSTNEELLTVNEELHVKIEELASTNEDLNNIKVSIDYPILVVNKKLKKSVLTRLPKNFLPLLTIIKERLLPMLSHALIFPICIKT